MFFAPVRKASSATARTMSIDVCCNRRLPSQRERSCHNSYFLPKKDIIFPCPGFEVAFLGLPPADAVEAEDGLGFGAGTGSSSENDSQAGSSFVTVTH